MIRPLRQRHRRIFAVLGLVLPLAFAISIAARKPVPSTTTLPAGLAAPQNAFTSVAWERDDVFTKVPVHIRLLRGAEGTSDYAVSLSATENFVKPDLIVYWIAGNPTHGEAVPEGAKLLGAFSARELKLPAESATNEGSLILFSLADQEMVDVSKTFNLQKN